MAKPRFNVLNKGVILRRQMPHACKPLLFCPSSSQLSHEIYLQNILHVGVQNELEGLVPRGVDIVVEMLGSLPAVGGSGDEQLHVGIWSVNCGAEHRSGKGNTSLGWSNKCNCVKPQIPSWSRTERYTTLQVT